MFGKRTRREFLSQAGTLAAAGALAAGLPEQRAGAATTKRPHDFAIVEGHRDMWELSGRTRLPGADNHLPITSHLVPRLIEGGITVCIAPAGGGDSLEERDGNEELLEGNLRVLDLYLTDIAQSKGQASLLLTKSDIPSGPTRGKVKFFIDMEGAGGIQTNQPEPKFPKERSLALLRQFFRLGVRGIQLTHNGRNQVADGRGVDKVGSKLTPFGVEVVREMNRLGMMVGVAHLSTNALIHAAEISKTPIVSTHQNLESVTHSNPPVEITEEEAKIIAKTGGIVGIRYHSNANTPYTKLAQEVEYLCKLIGPEHVGVGWLGHDKANPSSSEIEGHLTRPRTFTGPETQTVYEHYDNFIKAISERGLTDEQIGLVLGGNYLRIWKQILPEA
jgi:membrane dipeptidase